MAVYIQLIRPLVDMSALDASQEAAMAAHFERLQLGVTQGDVLLAGPCEDEAFGVILYCAADPDTAAAWAATDPAVQAGLMSSEVHPFRVSLHAPNWPTP